MSRSKVGPVFLRTIDRPATSLSPDDMKVAVNPKQWASERGLQALTKSQGGTGQRAPMPSPRRTLFRQRYYQGTVPHPDNTLGDQFGVTTRQEKTTGGRA
jgi:hypothetical protein